MSKPAIFAHILAGDFEAIRNLLNCDPGLVHAHQGDCDDDWTTLQCAAAKGNLPICKLLVESGAEFYTNPMCSYPPVIHAAWNRHHHVVDYFLYEIPDKAASTIVLRLPTCYYVPALRLVPLIPKERQR